MSLERIVLDGMNITSSEKDRLIISNLDYVEAIAKTYISRFPKVDLDDLVQAGRVGLIEAARRFDEEKAGKASAKFTTYAYEWIRKYILLECMKASYVVHVPDKELRKIPYKNMIRDSLIKLLGREPNFDELAKGVAEDKGIGIDKAKKMLKNIGMAEVQMYSLDSKIRDGSSTTFADVVEDPYRIEHTLEDQLPIQMRETIKALNDKEQRVLEMRFGIGIGRAYTLEETGEKLSVSKERIRQIEARALRKLRHPSRSRKLKVYLD